MQFSKVDLSRKFCQFFSLNMVFFPDFAHLGLSDTSFFSLYNPDLNSHDFNVPVFGTALAGSALVSTGVFLGGSHLVAYARDNLPTKKA